MDDSDQTFIHCCACLTASTLTSHIQAGDVLVSINGVSLLKGDGEASSRGETFFDFVTQTIKHAKSPKRVRFLRLIRFDEDCSDSEAKFEIQLSPAETSLLLDHDQSAIPRFRVQKVQTVHTYQPSSSSLFDVIFSYEQSLGIRIWPYKLYETQETIVSSLNRESLVAIDESDEEESSEMGHEGLESDSMSLSEDMKFMIDQFHEDLSIDLSADTPIRDHCAMQDTVSSDLLLSIHFKDKPLEPKSRKASYSSEISDGGDLNDYFESVSLFHLGQGSKDSHEKVPLQSKYNLLDTTHTVLSLMTDEDLIPSPERSPSVSPTSTTDQYFNEETKGELASDVFVDLGYTPMETKVALFESKLQPISISSFPRAPSAHSPLSSVTTTEHTPPSSPKSKSSLSPRLKVLACSFMSVLRSRSQPKSTTGSAPPSPSKPLASILSEYEALQPTTPPSIQNNSLPLASVRPISTSGETGKEMVNNGNMISVAAMLAEQQKLKKGLEAVSAENEYLKAILGSTKSPHFNDDDAAVIAGTAEVADSADASLALSVSVSEMEAEEVRDMREMRIGSGSRFVNFAEEPEGMATTDGSVTPQREGEGDRGGQGKGDVGGGTEAELERTKAELLILQNEYLKLMELNQTEKEHMQWVLLKAREEQEALSTDLLIAQTERDRISEASAKQCDIRESHVKELQQLQEAATKTKAQVLNFIVDFDNAASHTNSADLTIEHFLSGRGLAIAKKRRADLEVLVSENKKLNDEMAILNQLLDVQERINATKVEICEGVEVEDVGADVKEGSEFLTVCSSTEELAIAEVSVKTEKEMERRERLEDRNERKVELRKEVRREGRKGQVESELVQVERDLSGCNVYQVQAPGSESASAQPEERTLNSDSASMKVQGKEKKRKSPWGRLKAMLRSKPVKAADNAKQLI